MQVPYIEAELTKDQFSKFRRVFPIHELPIHVLKHGEDSLSVKEKTGDYLTIGNINEEVERLVKTYGSEILKNVFGSNFEENIELKIIDIFENLENNTGQDTSCRAAATRCGCESVEGG